MKYIVLGRTVVLLNAILGKSSSTLYFVMSLSFRTKEKRTENTQCKEKTIVLICKIHTAYNNLCVSVKSLTYGGVSLRIFPSYTCITVWWVRVYQIIWWSKCIYCLYTWPYSLSQHHWQIWFFILNMFFSFQCFVDLQSSNINMTSYIDSVVGNIKTVLGHLVRIKAWNTVQKLQDILPTFLAPLYIANGDRLWQYTLYIVIYMPHGFNSVCIVK